MGESAGRHWRRVYGGLVLLEELLRRGSPAVPKEIGQGLHFDPIQRLTFLERFEYQDDRRVQGMVRQKASALRANLLARMEGEMPDSPSPGSTGSRKGPLSPGGQLSGSGSGGRFEGFGSDGPGHVDVADAPPYNPAYPGFGSDGFPPPADSGASRNVLVNGLVNVRHRDDTDSESSTDDRKGRRRANSRDRGQGHRGYERRRPLEDSTDSDSSRGARQTRPTAKETRPTAKPPPPQVDLLDGMFDASAQPSAKQAGACDLLDF